MYNFNQISIKIYSLRFLLLLSENHNSCAVSKFIYQRYSSNIFIKKCFRIILSRNIPHIYNTKPIAGPKTKSNSKCCNFNVIAF